jgi:hypothetical protein
MEYRQRKPPTGDYIFIKHIGIGVALLFISSFNYQVTLSLTPVAIFPPFKYMQATMSQ